VTRPAASKRTNLTLTASSILKQAKTKTIKSDSGSVTYWCGYEVIFTFFCQQLPVEAV
jgi:hypothetical protein